MATRKNGAIRTLRVKKGDDLKTLYAKVRAGFTAADLQRYTETEQMFPAEQLVEELEAIHREEMGKRRGKKA
jgi:hypothetical protein